MGLSQDDIKEIEQNRLGGSLNFKIHPEPVVPNSAAIPLKNNILTYGPWYVAGPPGKVSVIQDTELVPWNYGGFGGLENAAAALVANFLTNMQEAERGQLQLAGAPQHSLGEALIEGGPNITSISVEYGENGVTTNYTMETYTPRYGSFSRGLSEHLRRIGNGINNQRKLLQQAARAVIQRQQTSIKERALFLNERYLKTLNPRSPHPLLQAIVVDDGDGKERCRIVTVNDAEARANCIAHKDDKFKNQVAYMSLDGIFRPFTTDEDLGSDFLPAVELPDDDGVLDDALYSGSLNPFGPGNDIDVYSYGEQIEKWNTYDADGPDTLGRFIALKAPLFLVGWGYGAFGGTPPSLCGGTDFLRKSSEWKAGPVDLLWDEYRKVWTSHDVIMGTLETDANPGSQGTIKIDGTDITLSANNFFSSIVTAGTKVFAAFNAFKKAWYLISADCGS